MRALFLLLTLISVCGGTAFVRQSSSPTAPKNPIPDSWKKIDLNQFSFFGPSDLKDQDAHGIDSAIWQFRNRHLDLLFDLGIYSNPLEPDATQVDYHAVWISIDGRKAKLVTSQLADEYLRTRPEPHLRYVSAVYFPDVPGDKDAKLTGWADCMDPATQESAKKMFLSIKFK